MADGNQEAAGGSWWGSWINSAKAKTSTVLEAVKKDLDELSTAVRTEASNVGAALNSTLQFDEETSPVGTVKKSISTFFGQVTEALVPSLEDDEVEAVLITREGAVTLTGFPKHLADLQQNDKTFTDEPLEELAGKYKRWLEVIEQDQFTQNQLSKHLASSEILNEKYLSLVPTKVPHMEFWKRYLFKRALLEDAIANAELVEKRAKAEVESVNTISPRKTIIQTEQPKLACSEIEISSDEPAAPVVVADEANDENLEKELLNEEIYWGSEEIPSNIELSEEEQTRLLEEYEQEIQEREKRKSLVLNDEVPSQNNVAEAEIAAEKPQPSKKAGQVANNKKQNPENKKNLKSNANSKQSPKKNNNDNSKQKPKQQQQQQEPSPKKQPQEDNPVDEKGKTMLSVQKDHFNKEENSSSTSDESWEKDFDLDE